MLKLMRLENRKMKMKAAKAKHPERWPHKKVAEIEPVGKTVMYFGQIKQSDSCETVPDSLICSIAVIDRQMRMACQLDLVDRRLRVTCPY